jgi:hypothetical protein
MKLSPGYIINIINFVISFEQVEVLSAVVNSIADSVRGHTIVDVGAGQVCPHFLLLPFSLLEAS